MQSQHCAMHSQNPESACQSRDHAISVAFTIGPWLLFGFPLFIMYGMYVRSPCGVLCNLKIGCTISRLAALSRDWLHYLEIGCTISRLAALSRDWLHYLQIGCTTFVYLEIGCTISRLAHSFWILRMHSAIKFLDCTEQIH